MPLSTSSAVTLAPVAAKADGERPETCPDLEDAIGRADPRQTGDACRRVRVGDKVLAERLGRMQTVLGEKTGQLASSRRPPAGPRRS